MNKDLSRRAALIAAGAAFTLAAPSTLRAQGAVLRFGDQSSQIRSIMDGAGELKNMDYKVEFANFSAAAPVLEAENAGAIDAGFGGDAAHAFAISNGLPSKIIYAERSDPACIGLIVPASSTAQSIKDLKGKSIATGRGSIAHYLIVALLQANGMMPDDVKFVFLQPPEARAAFYSGSVDGWGTWTLYIAQAVLVEKARVIGHGRGNLNNNAFISATNSAIASKRANLQDFADRYGRARLWALANLDVYANIWAEIAKVTPEVAKFAYSMERFRPTPIDSKLVAEWGATARFYEGMKLITRPFDAAAAIAPGFQTNAAILADAAKVT